MGVGTAVEVAPYRIAVDALANVARHASAGWASVSLDVPAGDDGRGDVLVLQMRDGGTGTGARGRA